MSDVRITFVCVDNMMHKSLQMYAHDKSDSIVTVILKHLERRTSDNSNVVIVTSGPCDRQTERQVCPRYGITDRKKRGRISCIQCGLKWVKQRKKLRNNLLDDQALTGHQQ